MIRVTVIGRLTSDPVLNSDRGVCNFTVASRCGRLFDNKEKSEFVRCATWGKRGEVISANFHKGDVLSVAGELTTHEYIGHDNEKRIELQIGNAEVEFIPRQRNNGESSSGAPAPQPAPQQPKYSAADVSDDELPF